MTFNVSDERTPLRDQACLFLALECLPGRVLEIRSIALKARPESV